MNQLEQRQPLNVVALSLFNTIATASFSSSSRTELPPRPRSRPERGTQHQLLLPNHLHGRAKEPEGERGEVDQGPVRTTARQAARRVHRRHEHPAGNRAAADVAAADSAADVTNVADVADVAADAADVAADVAAVAADAAGVAAGAVAVVAAAAAI